MISRVLSSYTATSAIWEVQKQPSRQALDQERMRWEFEGPAGWKPAIRQVTNLRYGRGVFAIVTQIFNLPFRRFLTGGGCAVGRGAGVVAVEGSADCKPAIRQVTKLRYVVFAAWAVR